MSDQRVDIVAKALEQCFKDSIVESYEKTSQLSGIRFEQLGVQSPKQEIWQRYAKAAIKALEELNDKQA